MQIEHDESQVEKGRKQFINARVNVCVSDRAYHDAQYLSDQPRSDGVTSR